MAIEIITSRMDLFLEGAGTTLLLTLVSGFLGLGVGLGLCLCKGSQYFYLKWPAEFGVWIVRGTPLLVQILFAYFALPMLFPFLKLDEFSAAALALTINVGAYNSEVFRAGFESVPRGQREAAKSLGLSSWVTFLNVVFPQALRVAIPPLVNNIVALLKDSSLASAIGLLELSLAGQRVSSETFQPVPVLTSVAFFYLTLTTLITFFTTRFEKSFSKKFGIKKVRV